jgi:uncharacterized Tic20 family protein
MNDGSPSPHASDPLAQHWEKGYSVGMHLTTIAMLFFVPVIAPLVMWQIKKHESPFVDDHGKEIVNFQISLTIYGIGAMIVTFVTLGIGAVVVWPALFILGLVGLIMGAVAAGNGRYFRYPACVRFIK